MALHTRFLIILLQITLALHFAHAALTAVTYAQPLPCFGFCLALDPGLIRRYDGVYFRYNTNGGIYFQKSLGSGSAGIAGPWVDSGPALPNGSVIDPSVANLWAPYLTRIGDTYIMYYCLSHINTRNSTIGYATSQTLEPGSWTDHGSTGITTQEVSPASAYNAIDPTLILVAGKYFMSFGSYWSDIQIVPMNTAGTAPLSKFPTGVQKIEYQPSGNHAAEGSFIYQYTPPSSITSYFYLFWSEGVANGYDTKVPTDGTEYKIRVCRSTNVTSGYVDFSGRSCLLGYGESVLASHDQVFGPGGQGIIDDPCGPIMYYAYANTSESIASVNYKWGVNYLSWPNGWPVVSGTNSTQPLGYCTLSSTTSRGQTSSIPTTRDQMSTIPTSKAQTTTATTNGQQTSKIASSGYQESFEPTNKARTSTPALSQDLIPPRTTSKAQTSAAPNLAPSYADIDSVTAFPPPPAGVCSVTSVIYMFTSTIWVHPDDHNIPPPEYVPAGGGGGMGGVGDETFGCVPITRTVHV